MRFVVKFLSVVKEFLISSYGVEGSYEVKSLSVAKEFSFSI